MRVSMMRMSTCSSGLNSAIMHATASIHNRVVEGTGNITHKNAHVGAHIKPTSQVPINKLNFFESLVEST